MRSGATNIYFISSVFENEQKGERVCTGVDYTNGQCYLIAKKNSKD